MKTQLVEINEATLAGHDVLNQIEMVQNKLHKAKTWGFIDLFSDGGLLSAIFKHDNLHDAQQSLTVLEEKINKFNDELDDVKIDSNIKDVMMSKGIEIADWLLDGLFIDVYTLSKIGDSQRQLDNLRSNVEHILSSLNKISENL